MMKLLRKFSVCWLLLLLQITACHAADSITILYDAFGPSSELRKDWGFSALIEYQGKHILFDMGDNAEIFAHNVRAKNIDLTKLDFAVISHRHGDHIGGISYLLNVNPGLKIYAPKENFGIFGSSLPSSFYRRNESLPADRRYFDGKPPDVMQFGKAWSQANFELVEKTTEIVPGLFLISLVSSNPGTMELHELSLVIKTPKGLVIIVGCSHPGIEKIIEAAAAIDPHIHLIAGGLHLVTTPDQEVERISLALRDTWKVDYIAPGHCTGEPAFAALAKDFGNRYVYAGLGSVLMIGDEVSPLSGKNTGRPITPDPEYMSAYKTHAMAELNEERFLTYVSQLSRPASQVWPTTPAQ